MTRVGPKIRHGSTTWVAIAAAALIAGLIGVESFPALAIVLLEGTVSLAVLATAGLAGGWVARWLKTGKESRAERFILGAGLGIGLLSLIVLGLGSAGLLTRVTAFLLCGGLAAAGLIRLMLDLREMGLFSPRRGPRKGSLPELESSPRSPHSEFSVRNSQFPQVGACNSGLHWLWLGVCPFVAMMLLAACLPPGVLWEEEGYGYDVLEYHLAVPKIFYEQGALTFLPNNVYSNFPLNSEMLSLLMMMMRGDPIEGTCMAVIANVGLAALFMAGAWLAGRRFSPQAGIIAGVLAGTTPWIAYLAGIAYVEVGMLAMGMCALAITLKKTPPKKINATPFSAGLLAGLACGFKYTAVPLIALPIGFVILVGEADWPRRVRALLLYGCGALMTFSPWMIRNTFNTGNPVFPLAYSTFGDRSGTWDDALYVRWQRVHGSAAAEHTDVSLLARAWTRTGEDYRLGAATFILAAVGAIRRRDRWTAALLAMLIVQVIIWLTATHLFARFAIVMLLPALALAARSWGEEGGEAVARDSDSPPRGPPLHGTSVKNGNDQSPCRAPSTERTAGAEVGRYPLSAGKFIWVVLAVLATGSAWNLYRLTKLYYHHTRIGGAKLDAYGQIDWFTTGQWPGMQHWGAINDLGENARIMLVGEARTFYSRRPCEYAVVFNRHPLAEAIENMQDPAAVLGWLRRRGITHLLVHWAEIERLGKTYGFPPELQNPLFYRAMIGAGLKEAAVFTYGNDSGPYAILYKVPRS